MVRVSRSSDWRCLVLRSLERGDAGAPSCLHALTPLRLLQGARLSQVLWRYRVVACPISGSMHVV